MPPSTTHSQVGMARELEARVQKVPNSRQKTIAQRTFYPRAKLGSHRFAGSPEGGKPLLRSSAIEAAKRPGLDPLLPISAMSSRRCLRLTEAKSTSLTSVSWAAKNRGAVYRKLTCEPNLGTKIPCQGLRARDVQTPRTAALHLSVGHRDRLTVRRIETVLNEEESSTKTNLDQD